MIRESVTKMRLPYPDREDRLVRVWVPAHREGETFPVVYLTDGQNLFDRKTSTFGCWRTREAVRAQRQKRGGAAVIVGIHNSDPWRVPDLTPASIGPLEVEDREFPGVPGGEVFDAFVTETLMPAVEAGFPVKTGRENTAFCGSSMGGLMALFTALRHPELYGAAGVFSPALMLYRPEDLAAWIRDRSRGEHPWLLLFAGGADELEKVIADYTRQAEAVLRDCWPEDSLRAIYWQEAHHHETAWERVFRVFLREFLSRSRDAEI